jgi:hypothetical protein
MTVTDSASTSKSAKTSFGSVFTQETGRARREPRGRTPSVRRAVGKLGASFFISRVESYADVLPPDSSLFVYTLMVPLLPGTNELLGER